ncbi:MAG: hypothetical protein GXO79_05440 [Chlorobi bacterium]|nr:hypothetical protein [Chlorobiota bacterium]
MGNKNELPFFIGCEEYKEYFFKCSPLEQTGRYIYTGITPGGGAKLIFFFVDSNSTPVEKERANFVELQEFDKENQLIHIEHGKSDAYRKWTEED